MPANALRPSRLIHPLALVFAAVLLTGPAAADRVHLSDGSELVGTITRMDEAELVMDTAFAEGLTLPADQIEHLSTDDKITVALSTGDRVVGRLTVRDGRQVLTDTTFGEVTLAGERRITGLWPTGEPTPESAEQREQLQAELAEAEAEHEAEVRAVRQRSAERIAELEAEREQLLDPWSGRFAFGLNGDTGNEERFNFRGEVSAKREIENERLFLRAGGRFSEENSERTKNEVLGSALLERDISERFFLFGKGGAEFDEFENLDLRTTLTGGLGYFVIREEAHEFKVRGGAGFQHESFDDGTSESQGTLEFGYDYRIDLNENLRFTQALTYYPLLDDPISDYRLEVETAGELPISADEAWKLRAGMRNNYDAMPQDDVERLDTYYFLDLVYDWD